MNVIEKLGLRIMGFGARVIQLSLDRKNIKMFWYRSYVSQATEALKEPFATQIADAMANQAAESLEEAVRSAGREQE